jgi:tetratricopeptide (TPR) repeat protein
MLANVLVETRLFPAAAEEYALLLRRAPEIAEAHFGLGNALFNLGRIDEAIACYEEALRRRPGFAAAEDNLGKVRAYQAAKRGR